MTIAQNDLILEHLLRGRTLTPLEALELYGCLRLAARVKNLRDDGYKIKTETRRLGRKRWAEYSL